MTPGFTLSPESPWPGLRPFNEDDRGFFFGRERESAELLALVQRAVVVVVYGQSGLGKTSLLQAGLFPAVRDAGLLPVRLRLDHSEHAASMATQVKTALTVALDAAGVTGPRPGATETLWEYFHRRDVDLWGARNRLVRPVIAFDQFEEVFTLGQRSQAAIARVAELTAELESLLEHRAPDAVRARLDQRPDDALKFDFQREGVKFVISLREDFLAQLDTWRTRMPSLLPHRFRLERMTGAQALEVVQRAGGDLVDAGVAQEIVDFVSRSQRRAQVGALQARNVEPALLSVVCDELNRRRLDRKQPRITADLLSGERQGIIQAFYNRAFEDVDARARDWIEDELLTASGYRDRAAQEDALRAGVKEIELDRLVDRRVLHREERDGVVWLELTHDLLTDPAYASRTQREQRRVAAEALRREAETAHQLQRTRRLAAGFAVLSLAMIVALFFAVRMSNRAAEAQASMQKERDRAIGAEASKDAALARAQLSADQEKAAAERASSSFSTAMGMAEPLGQTLHDFVHGDMRLLTKAVREIITTADDSYRLLEAQDPGATADQHARFLTIAAQALCDVGYLSECVARAEQALAILDALPAKDAPGRRAIRAETMYARGAAYATTGRQAQARRDYAAAIALAQAEARSSAWSVDLARVNVLSELGLAELDRWSLANPSAEAHCQRALTFLDSHALKETAQTNTWRVQALMGLALSVADAVEQDRRYARADGELQKLAAADPDNLRTRRLAAELWYQRGWTDSQLDRTWVAVKFAEKGEAASVHLTQHDPENLQWRLSWIRSQRVIGVLDRHRGLLKEAAAVFEAAEKAGAELVRAEPLWRQARYVHGTALLERGQTNLRQNKPLDQVLPLMEQSRAEFEAGIRRAPGDLEFVRGVTLAISGMAEGHLAHAGYDEVIRLSKQAIQALAPTERGINTDSNVLNNKAFYLGLIGQAWVKKKNWKEATDAYASRVSILEPFATRSRLPVDETALANALADLGRTWWIAGDNAKAAAQLERASDAVTRALAGGPADTASLDLGVYVHRVQAVLQQDDPASVLDHLKAASDLAWNALQHEAWNTTLQADLVSINEDLAALKKAIGTAGLPPAQSASLVARLNPLIVERQAWRLIDWVVRPMMPGSWINLADTETDKLLTAARQLVVRAYPRLVSDQVFAVRILPLNFRTTGDVLYEAGIEDDNGRRGIVAFVTKPQPLSLTDSDGPSVSRSPGRFVLIDGSFSPRDQLNSEAAPRLETVEQASAFVHFLLASSHPPLGPYTLVERDEDILWRPDAPAAIHADVRKQLTLTPLRLTKKTNGSWDVEGVVTFGDGLRRVTLTVTRAGAIENDNVSAPLVTDLPIQAEYLDDGVKTLRDVSAVLTRELVARQKQLEQKPQDRRFLQDTTELAAKLTQWKVAATMQQRLTEVILADPAAKADLSGAYLRLSWYQLFARDFDGALTSTNAGRLADGAGLPIETNRAHALLFLGRTAEAEAIYRAHIGQKIWPGADQLWEQVILQDLDDLEQAGITHRDFARIRRILSGKF